jgi:hypothetical protein
MDYFLLIYIDLCVRFVCGLLTIEYYFYLLLFYARNFPPFFDWDLWEINRWSTLSNVYNLIYFHQLKLRTEDWIFFLLFLLLLMWILAFWYSVMSLSVRRINELEFNWDDTKSSECVYFLRLFVRPFFLRVGIKLKTTISWYLFHKYTTISRKTTTVKLSDSDSGAIAIFQFRISY